MEGRCECWVVSSIFFQRLRVNNDEGNSQAFKHSLVLRNLRRATIIRRTYANHEPINHFRVPLSLWVNPFSESSPSPSHVRVRVRVFLSAEIIYTFLWFNIQKANTKCFHRRRLYLNVSFWRGSLFLLIPPITTESPVQLLQPDYQALGKYRD